MFVSAGLLVPAPAGGENLVDTHVPGDRKLTLTECNNEIRNNFVNGSLHIVMKGQTLQCTVTIKVSRNWVYGNLILEVKQNKVFGGSMKISVEENDQVGGTLKVLVKDNEIHKRPSQKPLPYDLEVKIDKNGGNARDITKNEVIGMGLKGEIVGNWVKNTLDVDANQNFVGFDYGIEVGANIVNNLYGDVKGSYACRNSEIQFKANTVDTEMKLNLNGNRATYNSWINVTDNDVPFLDPRLLVANIKDNHAAKGDLEARVNANTAKKVEAHIEWNGAGTDGTFEFKDNKPDVKNEIHILDNRVESVNSITVMGNDPQPQPYVVKRNWACTNPVIPQLQPGATQGENDQKCTQMEQGDYDKDGLHDDYEKMIGTDPWHFDTDRDGIWDGWGNYDNDTNIDTNEPYGEIGQPLGPVGSTNSGAVDTLFNEDKEKQNCFCKDIYVEVDFMKKEKQNSSKSKGKSKGNKTAPDRNHKMNKGQFQTLKFVFLTRGIRLHVDLGWRPGIAGSDARGGGEWLRHKSSLRFTPNNDTTFDFYNFKNGEVYDDYDGDGVREPRHFSSNRKGSFHYAIIGHNLSENGTSIGRAEQFLTGDDFFISHAAIHKNTTNVRVVHNAVAYAFCHELGHNLNLGWTNATHTNGPPGYWSCMSYHPSVANHYQSYSDGIHGSENDWHKMDVQKGVAFWYSHDFTK
jgi:hypothetical protein